MWNPFKKGLSEAHLTWQDGFDECKTQVKRSLGNGRTLDETVATIHQCYFAEDATCEWYLPRNPVYRKGFKDYLLRMIQANLNPIPVETPPSEAVPRLQFGTKPPTPKQVALTEYDQEKYDEAEAYFEMLMRDEQMTALESYDLMTLDRCINNRGTLGFQAFLDGVARNLNERDRLEALLEKA